MYCRGNGAHQLNHGRAAARHGRALALFAIVAIIATTAVPTIAGDGNGSPVGSVMVSSPVTPFVVDVDLRNLPAPPEWELGMPIREIPRREFHPPSLVPPEPGPHGDPLADLQRSIGESWGDAFTTPTRDFTGFGYQGVNPSDPVGDVGPNHYIHASNAGGSSVIKIWDKAEPTPNLLATTTMSAIAGGTGACASGYGDPVVIHDQFADRWLLVEFASSGNSLCTYMSQTADPVAGGWYVYQFTFPNFPDYHKWGVWRDAYAMAANENSPSACAFDRTAMLAGAAATYQRFTAPDLTGFGFQTLTPADTDGPLLPPVGSPIPFIRHIDNEAHSGFAGPGDYLQLWFFDVDWTTPANSTFTASPTIQVAEFDSALCGLSSFYCIGKPGVAQGSSSSLDPLREPVMYRLAYRNFGDHEAMVGNLATDVNGADLAGVRWFELRGAGNAWGLYQEGTYSLDSVNRWMGSIAMDGAGNIAMGYSVSDSTSVYPGLRYAGRLAGDTLGTLPQGEASILEASANNGSNRWGDYASINIDPSDDCTFWFTGMYGGPTSGQWSTRIASFKFDACGTPDFYLSPTPESLSVCSGSDALFSIAVGSVAGYDDPVTLNATGHPAGTTVGFNPNPVNPLPGASTMTISNTAAAAAGLYPVLVTGIAPTITHDLTVDLNLFTSTPGTPSLVAPADGATNQTERPTFDWVPAADGESYHLQVAADAGFSSLVIDQAGITDSEFTATSDLTTNTQYWWRVESNNACGLGPWSAIWSFTTVAAPGDCGIGTAPLIHFSDDLESGASGWSTGGSGNTWALGAGVSGSGPHSGSNVFHANDVASITDQLLITPPIVLPSGAGHTAISAQFWNYQEMEPSGTTACFDGGLLEITTDGGANWTQLPTGVMQTDPYDGLVSGSFSNPLAGLDAWCGDPQDWLRSVVDLDAYAGETVQLRFRLGTDSSVSRPGWDIDDIKVQSCVPSEPPFFADGFETGDTSGWSVTTP